MQNKSVDLIQRDPVLSAPFIIHRLSGSSWFYWVTLIAVATIVRVGVVFFPLDSMPLVGDALSYSEEGKKLLAKFPGETAYFWPPGLPYVLAFIYWVFGDGIVVARVSTIILSVLNTVMIALLSGRVLKDPRAARLSGWIAAFYPPDVMMAGQTYTQHLAAFCLLVMAFWLLMGYERKRWWYFGLAGLALGWGSLTRPSLQSLALVLLILLMLVLWRSPSVTSTGRIRWILSGSLAFVLGAVGCMVPVMHYNASHGAGWTISTNNERNLFLGNNPYTPYYKTSQLGQRGLDQVEAEVSAYLRKFYDREDARQAMMGEAIRYITEHPFITLWRTMNRIRAFWGFDYIMSREIQEHYGMGLNGLGLLLTVEAGGYCLVMLMILAGLFCAWQEVRLYGSIVLILLVIGYQLPYAVAFSGGTYHFPVMGLLMPFAGATLTRVFNGGIRNWTCPGGKGWMWLSFGLFTLIQAEYAYYLISMK